MLRTISLLPFGFLLLVGCQQTFLQSPHGTPRIRVQAETVNTTLNLTVGVEGMGGEAVSGAQVTVRDPGNGLLVLRYNAQKSAYTSTSPAMSGDYQLTVDSNVAGLHVLKVPVRVLEGEPALQRITDGEGHEARKFQNLRSSTPIRAEWAAVKGAALYQLEARQAGKVIWFTQVKAPSAVVPANTFQVDNATTGTTVTLGVTATFQEGDLEFKKSNVLSYTSVAAPMYTFTVVP